MSILAGIDLNGLWDWAAFRDTEIKTKIKAKLKDGGINSATINLQQYSETVVVGPQAALAAHGRGEGWGSLGNAGQRTNIYDALKKLSKNSLDDRYQNALIGLANELVFGAHITVAAVPDDESFNEGARDRLLRLLELECAMPSKLLWRSVAAVLYWVSINKSHSNTPNDGDRIAVLSILRKNVHFSELNLTKQGDLIVPVRHSSGKIAIGGFGGASLACGAGSKLAEITGVAVEELLQGFHSLWEIAVGERPRKNLFRHSNGSWEYLSPPCNSILSPPSCTPDTSLISRLHDADTILIEGPAASAHELVDSILAMLEISTDDSRIHRLVPEAAAIGCLEANERLYRGVDVYLDFLPQLEINAHFQGKPQFVSLIPESVTSVPGNTEYYQKAFGEFYINKGADSLTFYLVKQDLNYPRKSRVSLPSAPDQQYPISVSVRQTPGQGYAKVRIQSDEFAALSQDPIELDWTQMTEVRKSKKDILSKLEMNSRLNYPNIYIAPGNSLLWYSVLAGDFIASVLNCYIGTELIEDGNLTDDGINVVKKLKEIARNSSSLRIQAQKIGVEISVSGYARFLDSDGKLPEELPQLPVPIEASELLDNALEKAEYDYFKLLHIDAPAKSIRDLLGFTTWCYWRCPHRITQDLLKWYRTTPTKDPVVRIHGLGRILHKNKDIRQFFTAVHERLSSSEVQVKDYEFSAIARILSTCKNAADQLNFGQAELFLRISRQYIRENNRMKIDRAYKHKFKNSVLMLTALLRYRRINPGFLKPNGPENEKLLALLSQTDRRISVTREKFDKRAEKSLGDTKRKNKSAARRLDRISEVIQELERFLKGDGRDPNLIQKIDSISDN